MNSKITYSRVIEKLTVFNSQEISHLLWYPWVHYCVHKSLPLVSILSQMNPVHILPITIISILILSCHLGSGLLSCLFQSHSLIKILHAFPISPMRATCLTHHTVLELIILIMFGEECKWWSSSLHNFLRPPVTSPLIDPNILLSILFSNNLNLCSSLSVWDQISYQYKTAHNIIICIFESLCF
jgi:hypothetical protein